MKLQIFHSLESLKPNAHLWNALWEASDLHSPAYRFEILELYVRQFHPNDEFLALVVESDDGERANNWLAAIPVIIKRIAKVSVVAILPSNPWMSCGELLIDGRCEMASVIELIRTGLRELPCLRIRFDWINTDRSCWKMFADQLSQNRIDFDLNHKYCVGVTQISPSVEHFHNRLSKNRRKEMNRSKRELDRDGPLTIQQFHAGDYEEPIRAAFKIEHRSWKGREKTSIESNGLTEFYLNSWRELASVNCLQVWMLFQGDRPIAFDCGYRAKRVYCSHKIGFDESLRKWSPGHLLNYLVIETMTEDANFDWLDTIGELTESTSKWTSGGYPLGRIEFATSAMGSQQLLNRVRQLRKLKYFFCARGQSSPCCVQSHGLPFSSNPVAKHGALDHVAH